jgi:glycosyltransferase involved in cell wall biosynthesis
MKIVAAVLTYNQYENSRRDLFEQTVDSLANVQTIVVDNGSTDGTDRLIASDDRWRSFRNDSPNHTCGFGTWLCCRVLAGTDADICVVSDDDMVWTDGWADRLADWWAEAPEQVILTGGHLEPAFPWNEIVGQVTFGGQAGLIRQSTGAASWTFRRRQYLDLAGQVRSVPIDRQGTWDVPVCNRLTNAGWQIGQLDLADHAGRGRSSWGNRTETMYGWNVDEIREQLR